MSHMYKHHLRICYANCVYASLGHDVSSCCDNKCINRWYLMLFLYYVCIGHQQSRITFLTGRFTGNKTDIRKSRALTYQR